MTNLKAAFRYNLFLSGALGVITTTAMPMTGYAQTGQPTDGYENDVIVVTAQRRVEALSDVGMSISIVDDEILERRNIDNLDGLASLVPGFTTGESGFNSPIYTLRGVGVNEPSLTAGSSVAIYFDEVPYAYPVMTRGAIYDVERVEVLKGPQGTLYGQNSTAGAINYIAKKPTDQFEAGVQASLARFGRVSTGGYLSGPLGANLSGRIAFRTEHGGAWQESQTRDDEIGNSRRYNGRLILDWEPTSDLLVSLNANGFIDDSDTLVPQVIRHVRAGLIPEVNQSPLAPPKARPTDWDPNAKFRSNDYFYQGSIRINWTLGENLSLTSITAYSRYHADSLNEFDGTQYQVSNYQVDGEIKSFSHETRLAGAIGPVDWIVGANITDDSVSEVLTQEILLHPSSAFLGHKYNEIIYGGAQDISAWAIFGTAEVALSDQFNVAAGIRYSEDKRRVETCTRDGGSGLASAAFTDLINLQRSSRNLPPIDPIPPGGCVTTGEDFIPRIYEDTLNENNVPWNVTLNWKPNAETIIYGRVSRGFKAGLFPTIAATNIGTLQPVSQEEVLAYELGARISFGRAVSLEGAVFQYDYDDKQLRGRQVVPVFGNVQSLVNIPKSRIRGVEFAGRFKPTRELSLSASGVYLDAKIREFEGFTVDGDLIDQAGFKMNFTPKWSLNADVDYRGPLNDSLWIFGGANVAYRSDTSAAIAGPEEFDIPAYTLVGAQLGLESALRDWKAWIWGKNLLNEYYWTNVSRSSGVYRFPGRPATYGITLSYDF